MAKISKLCPILRAAYVLGNIALEEATVDMPGREQYLDFLTDLTEGSGDEQDFATCETLCEWYQTVGTCQVEA